MAHMPLNFNHIKLKPSHLYTALHIGTENLKKHQINMICLKNTINLIFKMFELFGFVKNNIVASTPFDLKA